MRQKHLPRPPPAATTVCVITLDGSLGEGGGQVLRTALSLSLVTGKEFCIANIRANRKKPGLQNQHLQAVNAAAAVGQAEVEGAALNSRQLTFRPRGITHGDFHFAAGTAGSTTLILQTVLPALALAAGPSALVLEGGTHNPMAPPFDFLAKTFLPLFNRMGPTVKAKLDRYGFYPAGGGKLRVTIEPVERPERLDLLNRGNIVSCRCRALVANLPEHIGERELKVLKRKLPLQPDRAEIEIPKSHGMGNVLLVEIESANVTEVFVGFGEKGVRAEIVADRLAKDVTRYVEADVPAGEHLADQLLLPMTLAGGGSFVTLPLSQHALTNIEVIKQFLPVEVKVAPAAENSERVEVLTTA